ncbi:MAG: chromosome segregation protein SMC, partial [Chromatiales bacterium]|nr:chromosome segregation protein SMC [Chromatiales bacterium]
MRLEKIKLAGFKSFVDPTTVHFPSNLVGIVGPNGCGKSNTIDAVRWVMGESSAKMLRGESMADVIFNGSNSRKPVGTASIELVFDNSDGSAGGQYAEYNTISVKRQVSRDGQSNYFMNSVRCRRRDITDLFLGTGLGPRSYSIIEQGMISRLIEARPEELRAFLEEAAGISKYKERRRETENRIKHTRENLDRLNDLREEIEKQLAHLQRQAATAERYKVYKEQERRLKAELLALRWRLLDEETKGREKQIAERETDLEAAIAKQRRFEADIEQNREKHIEVNDNFNNVQGRYYSVGSDIARLEQSIQFLKESRSQHEQDLHNTEQAWQESTDHQQQDSSRLEEINALLEEQMPQLEETRAIEEVTSQRLAEAEQSMQNWQSEWENFNHQAAEPAQTAQVERTRINHLEQQEQNLEKRIERMNEELSRLSDDKLLQDIRELEGQEEARQEQIEALQERLSTVLQQISTLREENSQHNNELNQARERLQTARGRHASLEALQQAALGKQEDSITEWLDNQGLASAARLAEKIQVESDWQQAVETVLGFHLQAICVDGVEGLAGTLESLEAGSISLLDTTAFQPPTDTGSDTLLSKITAPWPMTGLLAGVKVADDLSQALQMRSSLQPGESLITRDGIWVGINWIRLNRESDGTSGVLGREGEIRQLAEEIAMLEERVETLSEAVQNGRERMRENEQAREQSQREVNELNRGLSDIRSSLSGKRTRAEHIQQRSESVRGDIEELKQQITQGREDLETARGRLHIALEEMETLGERREALIQRRDELKDRLTEVREEASRQRSLTHEIALRIESMRSSQQSLTQSLERMHNQLSHLTTRREELKMALEEG